jgi:eukaryotic-like serine/threonine-protein kinase
MIEGQKYCPNCQHVCEAEDAFCNDCGFEFREVQPGDWFYDGMYYLEELLGEGGMGSVWQAQRVVNRSDKTTVDAAVKILHRHYSEGRPDVVDMFKAEAKILTQLNNSHIVHLYEYGDDPSSGLFFIGMQQVKGHTLEDEIKTKQIYLNELSSGKTDHQRTEKNDPLPLLRVINLIEQTLDAMGDVHEKRIYHRDLKPSNLMLESVGGRDHLFVLDFGIARFLEAEQKGQGRKSMQSIMGTYPYMSPEHFNGESYGAESDIFALGIIMYEMLTGNKPFGGDQGEMPTTIMNKIENHPHPNPAHLLPPPTKNLSGHIRKILDKALSKNPKDRYRTCSEFQVALDKLRKEEESDFPWWLIYVLCIAIGGAIGLMVFAFVF